MVIPADVSPGDQFQTRVAGKTITVTCPDDGEPGQTIMVAFDAPPAVSGQPKSRVKLSLGTEPGRSGARAQRRFSCDVDRLASGRGSLRGAPATLALAASQSRPHPGTAVHACLELGSMRPLRTPVMQLIRTRVAAR